MNNILNYSKICFFRQLIIFGCLMAISNYSLGGNEAGNSGAGICDLVFIAEPICNEDCTYDFEITIEGTSTYHIYLNGRYVARDLPAGTYQVGQSTQAYESNDIYYDLLVRDANDEFCFQEMTGSYDCSENCASYDFAIFDNYYFTDEGNGVEVDIMANNYGDNLQIISVSEVSHGKIEFDPEAQTIFFDTPGDYMGEVQFECVVCDDNDQCDVNIVTIEIVRYFDFGWLDEYIDTHGCCIGAILEFKQPFLPPMFYAIPAGDQAVDCTTNAAITAVVFDVDCYSYAPNHNCGSVFEDYGFDYLNASVYYISPCIDCQIPELNEMMPQLHPGDVVDGGPVCGCDGVTYTDYFQALLAGVVDFNFGECSNECPVSELNLPENLEDNSTIFCPSFCAFEEDYTITEISAQNGSIVGIEQDGICVNIIMAETLIQDIFEITACNSSGFCETVTYIITTGAVNLQNDYVEVLPDTQASIDVLANDFGTVLTLTGSAMAEHGTVTQNGNTLVYTPHAGYVGEDAIEYSACGLFVDGEECSTATVYINIKPECNPYMSIEMTAGEDALICPSYCDLDLPITITETYSPENSNIEPLENGCFIYNAQPGVSYEQISILACSDLVDNCNDWTITINIAGESDYLFAGNDEYTSYNDAPIILFPLDNDLGLNLQIVSIGMMTSGTCNIVNEGQQLIYTPAIDETGTIQFDYTICNDLGDCTQGVITINLINPISTPFTTVPDIEITMQGQPVTICVLDNDIIETDNYEVDFIDPDFGIIEVTPENCVNYIPPISYTGSATFHYQLCDSTGDCSDLTLVTVFVEGASLLEANDDYEATDMNTEVVITPLSNDVLVHTGFSDNSDILTETVFILDQPENGSVIVSYGENCVELLDCFFFFYTPNVDFSGLDQFTYLLCGPETCDTATVYVQVGVNCSEFCVWPGDANNDGVANHLDVLNIGYNYGRIGPERLVQSTAWEAHAAFDWNVENDMEDASDPAGGTTPPSNNSFVFVDNKYSDSDGSGIIDVTDIWAISDNYGLTHGKTAEVKEVNESVQITLEISQENIEPGTWIDIDLFVDGVANQDVNEMYGIAFQIDYFNEYEGVEIVPADSIRIEFIDSWFNNYGADQTLSVFKNLNSLNGSSVLDIGYVKANHIGSNGGGAVARMSCFITENITGKTASEIPLYFKVINPTLLRENGSIEELNGSLVESEIISTGTSVEPTHILYNKIKVFPNPAKDVISINTEAFSEKITLVDVLGRVYYQKENVLPGIQIMSLESISTGVYFLKVKHGENVYMNKVMIN